MHNMPMNKTTQKNKTKTKHCTNKINLVEKLCLGASQIKKKKSDCTLFYSACTCMYLQCAYLRKYRVT